MASQYPQQPVQQSAQQPFQEQSTQDQQATKKNSKLAHTAHSWFKKIESSPLLAKIGGPVNKLSNKLGAEAFWPTTLDLEADKAARILRSFCLDGFYGDNQSKERASKALEKIPPKVIRNAKGLAIFTVMRMGLNWSGAGGSGIIIKRLPNGQWSPPSGILIHTLGWGLIAGADIYDCVAVIHNDLGMEGFSGVRCTLGGEIAAAVGPLGAGATLDSEIHKRQAPVWTYTKSRGLYVGVQIDGTVIAERTGENERFYGVPGIRHKQILDGGVNVPSGTVVQLWETLQAAEGNDYNAAYLPPPGEGAPGDHEVAAPREESHKVYDEYSDEKDRMERPGLPPRPAA